MSWPCRRRINTLIKACANAGQLQRAEYWLQRLAERSVRQNSKGYGKLLEAAGKAGSLPKASEYFERLEEMGAVTRELPGEDDMAHEMQQRYVT